MNRLLIPTLAGTRLQLVPLAHSHSSGMFELWSAPEVCKFAGSAVDLRGREIPLPVSTVSESDRLLEFWLDRAARGTGFRWAVVDHGGSEFVGAVGYNAVGAYAEYAYHFVPRFWGAGHATAASQLALSWAFAEGTELVEVFIEPANLRSIRLVERIGFVSAGDAREGASRYLLKQPELRR